MTDNLITREQAANMCGLTRQYLDLLATRKQGPSYFKIGKACRYDPAEVKAWLRARKVAL